MEENENINEHLKKSLGEYRVEPKMSSFDEILKKMEKKKRRRFIFFLFPGLLFFMATTFVVVWNNEQPISQTSQTTLPQKDIQASHAVRNPQMPVPDSKPSTQPRPQNPTPENDGIPAREKPVQQPSGNFTEKAAPSQPENTKKTIPANELSVKTGNELAELADQQSLPATHGEPVQTLIPPGSGSKVDTLKPDVLAMETATLPVATGPEIYPGTVYDIQRLQPAKDSLKKEEGVVFLVGPSFTPRGGRYSFKTKEETPYMEAYLKSKNKQNTLRYNYGFGLRAGIAIKQRWEVLAGFGLQSYSEEEPVIVVLIPSYSQGIGTSVNPTNAATPTYSADGTRKQVYTYWDYSLDVSRLFVVKKVFTLKAGLGLHVQQFRNPGNTGLAAPVPSSQAYNTGTNADAGLPVNKWLNTVNVKVGWIENLNKHIQLQLCPLIYGSVNSMFNKNYVIRQGSYGMGLEGSLLFKIR